MRSRCARLPATNRRQQAACAAYGFACRSDLRCTWLPRPQRRVHKAQNHTHAHTRSPRHTGLLQASAPASPTSTPSAAQPQTCCTGNPPPPSPSSCRAMVWRACRRWADLQPALGSAKGDFEKGRPGGLGWQEACWAVGRRLWRSSGAMDPCAITAFRQATRLPSSGRPAWP